MIACNCIDYRCAHVGICLALGGEELNKIKKGDTVKIEAKAITPPAKDFSERIDALELSRVKFISQIDILESNIQTCFEMINKQSRMVKEMQLQLESATRMY